MIGFLLIFLISFFIWIWLSESVNLYKFYFNDFWLRSFDFSGKTGRKYFWRVTLFNTLISLLLYFSGWLIYFETESVLAISILPTIYFIASIIPNISIQIRRLRDVGVKPVFILIGFIPLVNLVLLFWYLQPSNLYKKNKVSKEEIRLEELKSMLDRNVISEEEYKSMRKKTLGL